MLSLSPGGALGGPGEEVWTPKKSKICSTSSHTAPQGPRIYMTRYKFWLGAYVEFQPVGWPGWAWGGLREVWCEVDNARAHAPTKGASPNTTPHIN
jgi:hypothetical protein